MQAHSMEAPRGYGNVAPGAATPEIGVVAVREGATLFARAPPGKALPDGR